MSAEHLEFVDTNVLVYAFDLSAGDKHTSAVRLIQQLWESGAGCLSVQVLQEFYVTVTRKVAQPLAIAEARDRVSRAAEISPFRHLNIPHFDGVAFRFGWSFLCAFPVAQVGWCSGACDFSVA